MLTPKHRFTPQYRVSGFSWTTLSYKLSGSVCFATPFG